MATIGGFSAREEPESESVSQRLFPAGGFLAGLNLIVTLAAIVVVGLADLDPIWVVVAPLLAGVVSITYVLFG